MALNPAISRIDFTPQGVVLRAGDKQFTFPVLGAPPAPAAPALPKPTFRDDFASADPARFLTFDGSHWPPLSGTAGRWARMFMYGWPDNAGSQDLSARNLPANKELQCYEDRAVTLGPDGLVLTATRDVDNHGRGSLPWTSGCIVQNRDLAMLYGYFEMTAKLPKGAGFWPAFWLLAADGSWPPEIDVIEKVAKTSDNKPSDTAYRAGVVTGGGVWADLPDADAFNKFGCLWGPDQILFTLNGKSIGAVPTPDNCRRPMYMLANLAVGGTWPGDPATDAKTASMTVRSISSYAAGSWGSSQFPATP